MPPGSSPLCWDHRVKPARSSGCNAARAFAVWTQRCPRADDRRLAAIWSGKRTLPQQNSDHLLPCAVEGLLQVGEQLVGIHDSEHGETIVATRGRATGRVKAWLASSLLMSYRPLQRPQRQIPIVWTSTGPRRPRLVDTRTVKHGHAHLP